MWQNKLNGFLGLWVIALAFLGFSDSMQRVLLVATGLVITITVFLGRFMIRPTEEVIKTLNTSQNKGGDEKLDIFQQPKPKDPAMSIKPDHF